MNTNKFLVTLCLCLFVLVGLDRNETEASPGAMVGSDPFIGEISWVGFNFAPRGWALCNGQLLAISTNSALFALLGTTYGGDGKTTFGLPSLQGRVPMHAGTGAGLLPHKLGPMSGTETVMLTTAQMPSHTHNLNYNATAGNRAGSVVTIQGTTDTLSSATPNLSLPTLTATGGGGFHPNTQPFTVLNAVIAT